MRSRRLPAVSGVGMLGCRRRRGKPATRSVSVSAPSPGRCPGESLVTYAVYHHRAENRGCYSLPVFWILARAHHGVVAAGEHAADGREDYDGEDGDDDAVKALLR